MKTYICEICGEAFLGEGKPTDCPFCGARAAFIKEGNEANPIVNRNIAVGEKSKANLIAALNLEKAATAIYQCMSDKADTYEIKTMYKRLSRVEAEHVSSITKLLKIEKPAIDEQDCSETDLENFERTLKLEENATDLYMKFAQEADEPEIRIFFAALSQAEANHVKLIKNYLNYESAGTTSHNLGTGAV